jgi:hypothetical protein
MLIEGETGARWSVYSRDMGRNALALPRALQWKYAATRVVFRPANSRVNDYFAALAIRRGLIEVELGPSNFSGSASK